MAAEEQAGQEDEDKKRQQDKEGDEVRMLWESIINTIMEQKVSGANGKDWAEKDPCCHVADVASGEEDLDKKIISFCREAGGYDNTERLQKLIIYCCVYFLNAYEEIDSSVRQQLLKKGRLILETLGSKHRDLHYKVFCPVSSLCCLSDVFSLASFRISK